MFLFICCCCFGFVNVVSIKVSSPKSKVDFDSFSRSSLVYATLVHLCSVIPLRDLMFPSQLVLGTFYFSHPRNLFLWLFVLLLFLFFYFTSQARPQRTGLPTKTALAPLAKALRTSEPVRIPPSMYTSRFRPRTASTTSARASI